MTKSKIIKLIFVLGIVYGGFWYFAIKNYNYRITFTSSQPPGIIYDNLIKWNNGGGFNEKVVKTLNHTPFENVEQEFFINDTLFKINWQLEKQNDSTTLVIAKVKDNNHSFKQNLIVPFTANSFVKRSISMVENFGNGLVEHSKSYRISKVSNTKIPAQHCAYISLSSKPQDKASAMVKNIYLLSDYVNNNNIELDGDPFLEITEWNYNEELIKFDFCFPIKEKDSFPASNSVKFKKTTEKRALKTIFNGNYKISDRAWFSIIDYASTKGVEIEQLPVEIFRNDPHSGGNPLEWEAEVYMPIKEE